MVEDEEREARSDKGREVKAEHTRVSWGGTEAAFVGNDCTNYILESKIARVGALRPDPRVNYSGAGGIDNI